MKRSDRRVGMSPSWLPGARPELRRGQDAYDQFQAAEGGAAEESGRLRRRLDQHWAEVVTACVRADDPLAYGIDKLRRARATVACELNKLDAVVPHDRSGDLERLRRQLAGAVITRREPNRTLWRVVGS